MTDYVAIPGPLGAMLVAADERALLGVWFEGQKYHPDPAGWTHRPYNPLPVSYTHLTLPTIDSV